MNRLKPHLACLASGLFSFYSLFAFALFDALSKDMMVDMHLSAVRLGIFSSAFLFADALGLIPIGILLDKYGVRPVAITFIVLAMLAALGISASHSLLLSTLLRSAQGLASACSLLIAIRIASSQCPKTKALALGLIISVGLAGGIAGNKVMALFSANAPWREVMFLSALLGFIPFLSIVAFMREKPVSKIGQSSKFTTDRVLHLIRNPQLFLIGSYIGLMNLPIFILGGLWANLYLSKTYRVTSSAATSIASFIFFGIMIGAPLWGWLSDRMKDRTNTMMLAAILSLCCAASFTALPTKGTIQIGVIFFALGVTSSGQIVGYSLIADRLPFSHHSTAMGLVGFVENAIGALGQILFGFMVISSEAILLFPLAYLACIVLMAWVRQRHRVPPVVFYLDVQD